MPRPKPAAHICTSLRSRNALQHVTRATAYGNLQAKGRRPEWAPWSSTDLYTYGKNPWVWTHCLHGTKSFNTHKNCPAPYLHQRIPHGQNRVGMVDLVVCDAQDRHLQFDACPLNWSAVRSRVDHRRILDVVTSNQYRLGPWHSNQLSPTPNLKTCRGQKCKNFSSKPSGPTIPPESSPCSPLRRPTVQSPVRLSSFCGNRALPNATSHLECGSLVPQQQPESRHQNPVGATRTSWWTRSLQPAWSHGPPGWLCGPCPSMAKTHQPLRSTLDKIPVGRSCDVDHPGRTPNGHSWAPCAKMPSSLRWPCRGLDVTGSKLFGKLRKE